MMRFHYDSKVDALYMRFSDQRYIESDEKDDGVIFDYDKNGKVIGIEVLNASKVLPKDFKDQLFEKRLPATIEFKQTVRV